MTAGSARSLPAAVMMESDPRAAQSARVVPREANIQRLGDCILGYTTSPAKGGAPSVRHQYTRTEMIGMGYRNTLTKLVASRRQHGVISEDLAGWCTVIADIAAAIKGPGMTLKTAENQAVTIGISLPAAMLAPFVDRAAQWRRSPDYRPLTGAEVGQLVKLAWRERDDLAIRNIGSFDETPAECRRRKNAATQAALRAARGVKPRAPASVTATKWAQLGMARSTYYARGLHKLDSKIIVPHQEGIDDFPVQNPGNDDATVQKMDPRRRGDDASMGIDDFPVRKGDGR